MKLALVVGIAACVAFAPTGSEEAVDWIEIEPTHDLLEDLKAALSKNDPKDPATPVKIVKARMHGVREVFVSYQVIFQSSSNGVCLIEWTRNFPGGISHVILHHCKYGIGA